jgi:hypothetical protein
MAPNYSNMLWQQLSAKLQVICSKEAFRSLHQCHTRTSLLEDLDVDVKSGEYKRLGRWYSEDILCNVVKFLKGIKGWEKFDIDGEWSPPASFQKRASCKDA